MLWDHKLARWEMAEGFGSFFGVEYSSYFATNPVNCIGNKDILGVPGLFSTILHIHMDCF